LISGSPASRRVLLEMKIASVAKMPAPLTISSQSMGTISASGSQTIIPTGIMMPVGIATLRFQLIVFMNVL